MNTNSVRCGVVLAYCLMITACPAARFVGITCIGDEDCETPTTANEPLACTFYERSRTVEIRDLPFDHPELGLCIDDHLTTNDAGLVNCRMLWQFVPYDMGNGEVATARCDDYDFLSPAPEQRGDNATMGPTCLVRQVTASQAAAGKTGWYYESSAPQYCKNAAPAALVPRQRPDAGWVIDVTVQCSVIKALIAGEVEDVDAAECPAPREASASEIGRACSQALNLSDEVPTLELGSQDCATSACVTVPGELSCEDGSGGPLGTCSDLKSGCTCRCAGESHDPGPFCTCPDTHECTPVLTDFGGSPTSRGSYCLPKAQTL